jgi:hypothetical protein
MNGYGGKRQATHNHDQQAKIVHGARPVFHTKVSFQTLVVNKLRDRTVALEKRQNGVTQRAANINKLRP